MNGFVHALPLPLLILAASLGAASLILLVDPARTHRMEQVGHGLLYVAAFCLVLAGLIAAVNR